MRISKLQINSERCSKLGIKPINIEKLGSVVALVGKNGSGKTRALKLLGEFSTDNILWERCIDNSIINLPNNIKHSIDKIIYELSGKKNLDEKIKRLQALKKGNAQERHSNKLKPTIASSTEPFGSSLNFQKLNNEILKLEKQVNSFDMNLIKITETERTNLKNVFRKYFKVINQSDVSQLTKSMKSESEKGASFEVLLEKISEDFEYDEFSAISKTALDYLLKLPHQLAHDKQQCKLKDIDFAKMNSYRKYFDLQRIFNSFLGKKLEWDIIENKPVVTTEGVNSSISGFWKINNRKFNYDEFSDGEKTLFSYVLLFFLMESNKNLKIKECIVIIDEPELHLHPDAEISLIDGIRKIIGEKGQLWIATHSINILSHLNYNEVFIVEDGKITHPSSKTQKTALSQLMSLDDKVLKLSNFLSSISDWTYINFMTQCFNNPEAIENSGKKDLQIEAFKAAISKYNNNNIILLDFGAGKGRLIEQLKEDLLLSKKVQLNALEPEKEYHAVLKQKGAERIYSSHKEIPPNSIDCVVLCNVLHEIPVNEWTDNLNNIINGLKQDGFLVIIEASVLNTGEKVEKAGYILLDVEELKELFELQNSPTKIKHKDDSTDSIMCISIPKKDLKEINQENVLNSLVKLENNSLEKIKKLRQGNEYKENPVKAGLKSAFLSQLHINSRIAQEEIKGIMKKRN